MKADPPAAAVDEAQVVSLVETDAFCECGYNLHGQRVWRDPSLELLVCRCPECGRHAAAGRFTGIHSVWLQRLSMGLILLWILFLLALFGFLIPMCAAWPNIDMERRMTWVPVPGQGPNPTEYMMDFDKGERAVGTGAQVEMAMAMSFSLLNGWLLGAAAAVVLWHLRQWAYLMMAMPLAVAVFVYVSWLVDTRPMGSGVAEWLTGRIALYAVTQAAMVAVGIWTGRPVARGLLRFMLPSRLLQHLAFLWYRDGKTPPFENGSVAA